MKDYAEIYASLREEIMQAIDEKVDSLLAEYDVDNLSDLENAPTFVAYSVQSLDGSWGDMKYQLIKVVITDICVGGECIGEVEGCYEAEPYGLYEFITDSLIEIYEKLCEYGN